MVNKTRYNDDGYKGGRYDSRYKSQVGGDHYVKCEKCFHSEDVYYADKYRYCPKCGAEIIRRGNNLRTIVKAMQSRQKEIMRDLNEHGNYTFFESMSDGNIESTVKEIDKKYNEIDDIINRARNKM